MSLNECFVYVLFEHDFIKIGMSETPAHRARVVTPDVERNISYALVFDSRKKARNCELALHRFFSAYQIPAPIKQGRTEFFNRACAEKLQEFIIKYSDLLGYASIKKGDSLFSYKPKSLLNKNNPVFKNIINAEELRLLAIKANDERLKDFMHTFAKLKSEDCLVGLIDGYADENTHSIFILLKTKEQIEDVKKLYWNGQFYDGFYMHYLFEKAECDEFGYPFAIDSEFDEDIKRILSQKACYFTTLGILPRTEEDHLQGAHDFFLTRDNLYSLPILEGEKLALTREIMGLDVPDHLKGVHLYEEKEDGSESRIIFYAHSYPDDIALNLCRAYWQSPYAPQNGSGPWHYVVYKGTTRQKIKLATLGQSIGDQRHFHPDSNENQNFIPLPVITKDPDSYEILDIHSVRVAQYAESLPYNFYSYYYKNPMHTYGSGRSRSEAYLDLKNKCAENSWTIIEP